MFVFELLHEGCHNLLLVWSQRSSCWRWRCCHVAAMADVKIIFNDCSHTRLIPRSQSRSTIIHVHTSSFTFTTHRPNAGTADPAFRDHTRLGSRLQFRDMTIRVHTSSLTFTPCQPDAGTADPAFGDHTRLRPRLQSRSMLIHIHTSTFTFTPHQPNHRVATRWFGDRNLDPNLARSLNL